MLTNASELFFQFPTETSQRILHPLEINDITDDLITATFLEPGITPEPEQEVLIYYEMRTEFMQQSARVHAVLEDEPRATVALRTTGQPVSAESRECYRARTMLLSITCDFGGEARCPVQDVSATGLSVIAAAGRRVGETVRVSFQHESTRAEGTVCVQSVRELPSGRARYGLHSVGKSKADQEFRDALSRISLAVQRLQLRRLSGTG